MSMAVTNAKRVVMREMPMTNAERMYALDEAWNARDWDTFDFFHDQDETVVYWPGRQDTPTHGGHDHREESIRFSRAFPDNKVHHPYYILFGEGDFTSFVTHFTGTFTAARAARRDRHPADRQAVRRPLLHGGPLAGRQDRRGVPLLRQQHLPQAGRSRLSRREATSGPLAGGRLQP